MNCPKCGAILETDSKFCVSCGAPLNEAQKTVIVNPESDVIERNSPPQMAAATSPVTAMPKEIKGHKPDIIGLVVGTLFILVGFLRITSAGTTISSTSFGGDFYTYTYQGIVAISQMLATIESSLGWVIVAIGASIDLRALRR